MSTPATRASRGASINHLVLNVRDIEASHRFYTELIGFEQCGDLTHTMTMRFYRGDSSRDHDFALVQVDHADELAAADGWSMRPEGVGVNHFAIAYPDRQAWLDQLRHLRANGVRFARRVNHGMTHSAYFADPDGYGIELVYNVPAEAWAGDVDAALNYVEYLDPDDIEDRTDYQRFGDGADEPEPVPGRIMTRQPASR